MTRRAWLAALGGFVVPRRALAAGFHVTGTLTATEQESQEGYFQLGRELMIATRPNSPIHDDLRAMVGLEVQVSVSTVS